MKLEEYREKLTELEKLPWTEYRHSAAELQAEYLAGQVVPDAETAIKFIHESQKRGELPELDASLQDYDCELLELNDEASPDERWWRCRIGKGGGGCRGRKWGGLPDVGLGTSPGINRVFSGECLSDCPNKNPPSYGGELFNDGYW
jgi:hypothetical protein